MLTDWYPTKANPIKGVFIKEQIEVIRELEYNCLIGYRNEDVQNTSPTYNEDLQIYECNYRKSKIPFLSVVKLFFSIWRMFLRINKKHNIDLIHTHTFTIAFPAAIISKIYGIKHIHTEHWSEILLNRLNKIDSLKYKFVLKNIDLVLPVSEGLKTSILFYHKNIKFKIIPNIIDDKFSPAKIISSQRCEILFVGNLIKSKGVLDLLEVSKDLLEEGLDFSLKIIGDGILRETCENYIKENKMDSNVFLIGQIPYSEIHKYFQECSFYCQPSYFETFGITYRQAISCGKPIVAYKLKAFGDDFDKSNSLLCEIGDKKNLQENVKTMIKKYKQFNEEEIAEKASLKYSKDMFKKNISEVYNEVLS